MSHWIDDPAHVALLQQALNRELAGKSWPADGTPFQPLAADGQNGILTGKALWLYKRLNNFMPLDTSLTDPVRDALGLGVAPITTPGTPANIALTLILAYITKGKSMTADQITGIIRLALGLIGGYFVSKGLVTQSAADWVTAGALTAIPAVWSWYSNRPKVILSIADKAALK